MNRLKYLVPNGCTALSMLLGLASVYNSIHGNFEIAAWMILWGVLLDKLDGSFARLLDASSDFGAEFDSFADFVSFGIAPAFLLLFALDGNSMVHHGWLLASTGVFVVAVSARLARFNVSEPPLAKKIFYGIPTTLMGAILSSGYLAWHKFGLPEELMAPAPFLLLMGAFAMVSNIRLPKLRVRRNMALNVFQIGMVLFAYIAAPLKLFPEVLLCQSLFYTVVGVVWCALRPEGPGGVEGDSLLDEEEDVETQVVV
jgi:CDP-diacylglycerol---serine O-phosphatidyltransferase